MNLLIHFFPDCEISVLRREEDYRINYKKYEKQAEDVQNFLDFNKNSGYKEIAREIQELQRSMGWSRDLENMTEPQKQQRKQFMKQNYMKINTLLQKQRNIAKNWKNKLNDYYNDVLLTDLDATQRYLDQANL
jgi:hypothetical protein